MTHASLASPYRACHRISVFGPPNGAAVGSRGAGRRRGTVQQALCHFARLLANRIEDGLLTERGHVPAWVAVLVRLQHAGFVLGAQDEDALALQDIFQCEGAATALNARAEARAQGLDGIPVRAVVQCAPPAGGARWSPRSASSASAACGCASGAVSSS